MSACVGAGAIHGRRRRLGTRRTQGFGVPDGLDADSAPEEFESIEGFGEDLDLVEAQMQEGPVASEGAVGDQAGGSIGEHRENQYFYGQTVK